ncbi:MAG: hypothetical protein DME94_02145 [Verrucomicrobia bacterium]|nr:MAG: hypothetical protein DME94_02145 [Verrucomicrobiota bacterium]
MKAVADNFTNVYFRILLLLLGFPLVAQAGDVDFSNYDLPLYTQIVDTIKAKIAPRLGEGTLTRERYFIIPFAYQDRGNHPEFSHSFITVIRVFADNKQPNLTRGLAMRKYKNREFEAFTISWLPRDFLTNPHLCVFDGPGARLFPKQNKCPMSPGRNCTLAETIKKLLIEPSRANAYSTKERSNTGPMTVCIDKTRSPSVVFTLWPAWTSFSRMGGCSAPDS